MKKQQKKSKKSKSKSKKNRKSKAPPNRKKDGVPFGQKLKKKRENNFCSLSLLSLFVIPGDLPGREQTLLLAKHVYRGGFEYSGSSVCCWDEF